MMQHLAGLGMNHHEGEDGQTGRFSATQEDQVAVPLPVLEGKTE